MHTVECQLIFAGLFVLLMKFSNGSPVELNINQLMSKSPDKLGLVKYFNELQLQKSCNLSILDIINFTKLESAKPEPCLCTVIYNMTKEIESSNISISDVNLAKQQTEIDKKDYPNTFKVWRDTAKLSPSLKLLMDPLNNLLAWRTVCCTGYTVDILRPLCKFLNVEVILLYNSSQNQSLNNTSFKTSETNQESISLLATLKLKEQNKSKELLATNSHDDPKSIPLMPDVINEGTQDEKAEVPNEISDKEELEISSKDDENTVLDPTVNDNFELLTEPEHILISNHDNSKDEYATMVHTETKESQSILVQKNAFGGPEETHFLFYFGIMTLLSMLFYLALYNKKKIIALVIEGRRSTNHRRRPNTASYSKVETDDGSTVF